MKQKFKKMYFLWNFRLLYTRISRAMVWCEYVSFPSVILYYSLVYYMNKKTENQTKNNYRKYRKKLRFAQKI